MKNVSGGLLTVPRDKKQRIINTYLDVFLKLLLKKELKEITYNVCLA